MRDLVDTTEMYLRTVYELEEEGITPLRARIAERLEQSGPTVSQTVARMERDGLLVVQSDRSLELTDAGRKTAVAVMRKHRLAERLLTDVLGLDIDHVHDEACRWEHVMSVEVEKRVVAVVDDATHSPFGNPIPGLSALGVERVKAVEPETHRAIDLASDTPQRVRVNQLNEIFQVDRQHCAALHDAGIMVGSEASMIRDRDGIILIADNGDQVTISEDLAHAIRVEPLRD